MIGQEKYWVNGPDGELQPPYDAIANLCLRDCNDGQCVDGKCECDSAHKGEDCSIPIGMEISKTEGLCA